MARRVGEEVRQEASFRVFDARNVRDHAGGGAVSDGADDRIQTQLFEPVLIRFGTDPLVAKEHHGFLACRVRHVGKPLDVLAHESGEEVNPVALRLAGHAPRGVVGTAIHEQERELVEERGETHHIHLRAVLQPLLERIEHELAGGRMVDVERNLVFLVSPIIGQVVVHLDRIPDDVREERDGSTTSPVVRSTTSQYL